MGPLYPILDAERTGDRDPGPFLAALRDAGVRIAQLRAKTLPAGEFAAWARAGVRGVRGRGIQVLVNDRADVALLAGADGVHLGQDDLSPRRARALLGPKALIGLSTHGLVEVAAGAREPVDYLAIGPVFATGTKPDAEPVVGLEGVRAARRAAAGALPGPLVAIGGLDGRRGAAALDAGADVVAVISAVAGAGPAETADRARGLLTALRRRPEAREG